jgi:hypothetical protein
MDDLRRLDLPITRRVSLGLLAGGAAGLFALHDQRITLAQPSEDIRYYALRMKRARFSDANVEAAVSALALAGIPVYAGPADAEPVMQVAGAPSPLRLLLWQVRNLTLEVAVGGGHRGAELDSVLPAPEGAAPPSYLLAGYIAAVQTPGAELARELLGDQDWENAPEQVYPALVMLLLASDLAREQGPAKARTLRLPPAQGADACSAVQQFIDDAIAAVFGALKIDEEGESTIATDIWNWIVGAGEDVLQGLAEALTAPVTATIRAIAGVLAIGGSIVSLVQAWAVQVDAEPPDTRFGVGDEFIQGKLTATIDAGGLGDWPPEIAGCAEAEGITLPPLDGEGVPVSWKVSEAPIDLLQETGQSPLVEDGGRAELFYRTNNESPEVASGVEHEGLAIVEVWVERPDLAQLRDTLLAVLYQSLPPGIDLAVSAVLGPAIAELTSGLSDVLTDGYNFGTVKVIYHEQEITVTPETGEPSESGSACPVGEWMLLNLEGYLATVMQAAKLDVTVLGRSGTMLWSVNADGTYAFTADEFAMTFTDGTYTFQLSIEGEESGAYAIEGDRLIGQVTSGFLQMEVAVQDLGGSQIPFPGIGQAGGLRFACEGNDLLTWPPLDIPTDPVRWTSVHG